MATLMERSRASSIRKYWIVVLASSFLVSQAAISAPQKKTRRTPLTSVEVVTSIDAPKDPDDPGIGGGIDAANYFSRRLASKIGACTAKIRFATQDWATHERLTVVKVSQKPGDLLMHMTKSNLTGLFELTYRINLQQERARVTLFFYSADGSRPA